MDKKKTLILSVLGVIVLLIAVVGISYAMYTFTGTGSKENVITTGQISVSYAEAKQITLTNTYSATDAYGSNATNNPQELQFTVTAGITGDTTINYDVQFVVTEDSATGGLKDEHISFNAQKNGSYIFGSATTGVTMASRASVNGTILTTGGYFLSTGSFSADGSDVYVVKAWVNDTYDLPTTDTSTGNVHSNATTASTFKFKVNVKATA